MLCAMHIKILRRYIFMQEVICVKTAIKLQHFQFVAAVTDKLYYQFHNKMALFV